MVWRPGMSNKTYQMETSCPQCGCSAVSHLTADQIKESFGDVPNVDIECSECAKKFQTNMKEACPEYAKECNL